MKYSKSGTGVMSATDTGMIVVKSPCGWDNARRRIKIEMPVFWIPASIEIATRSSCFCLKHVATIHPTIYATHGKPSPATNIYIIVGRKFMDEINWSINW